MSRLNSEKLQADKKMDEYKKQIGHRIKEVRDGAGIVQVQFAEIVGCSQPKIYRIEQGERLPDVVLLKNISEQFDVTLEWLINGREIKKK